MRVEIGRWRSRSVVECGQGVVTVDAAAALSVPSLKPVPGAPVLLLHEA